MESSILRTPLTPVSIESLMSLQNIIMQKDACGLNELSKQNFERHLLKITKAASTFYTTNTLQDSQIRSLWRLNNEAKARRATKSVVLGKGKVMSYNDLVVARAKRAEKDAIRERKKSTGVQKRKHKRAAFDRKVASSLGSEPEPCVSNVDPELVRSEWLIGESEDVVPFKAPEARMY